MKLLALLVVYLAAFLLASAQQPDCDNILIRLAEQGTWSAGFPFLSTPSLTPPNTICGYLVGQESCCDASWFDFLETEWAIVRQGMQELQQSLDSFVEEEDQFRAAESNYDSAIDSDQDLTSEQKTALKNLFKQLFATVETLVSGIRGKFVPCIEELLRYAVGWSCLACRDVEFVDAAGFDAAVIVLADETCDDLGGACAPVLVLVYDFVAALENALSQYCVAFPDTSCPGNLTLDYPCSDETSCKNVICNQWSNGFDNTGGFSDSFSDSSDAKRNAHVRKYGGPMAIRAVDLLVNSKKMINRKGVKIPRQSSLNVTISYSNSGYQATAVGKASSLDTSPPESDGANQLFRWLNWF